MLDGADSSPTTPLPPNYHQGFGAVDMRSTIPTRRPALRLEFVDDVGAPQPQFRQSVSGSASTSGQTAPRSAAAPLHRPAGRALQNNLNLIVSSRPAEAVGNADCRSLRIPDPENNVEIVRVENPAPADT